MNNQIFLPTYKGDQNKRGEKSETTLLACISGKIGEVGKTDNIEMA